MKKSGKTVVSPQGEMFELKQRVEKNDPPKNMDPLCQALWDKTEAEFMAMFEEPSTPD